MRFYLGTHRPKFAESECGPLFLSAIRLRLVPPRKPVRCRWALDSGGYSELITHGRWTVGPVQYVAEVRDWRQRWPGFEWAAVQDWMCEPEIVAKTGFTVAEHQRRTIASYQELTALAPEIPWVPVVQGYTFREYMAHLDAYERQGIDLKALPLVGVGSVCRRQKMQFAAELVREMWGCGLKVHGFGFKLTGLRKCHPWLTSADSLAWSYRGRKAFQHGGKVLCGGRGGHPNGCGNCQVWAEMWREKVHGILKEPVQLMLF